MKPPRLKAVKKTYQQLGEDLARLVNDPHPNIRDRHDLLAYCDDVEVRLGLQHLARMDMVGAIRFSVRTQQEAAVSASRITKYIENKARQREDLPRAGAKKRAEDGKAGRAVQLWLASKLPERDRAGHVATILGVSAGYVRRCIRKYRAKQKSGTTSI
jgi:hypothetical protein